MYESWNIWKLAEWNMHGERDVWEKSCENKGISCDTYPVL